jgi:hypothetical protein
MIVAFLSAALIAIVSSWLAHFFSKRRDRIKEFNQAATDFQCAFLEAKQKLRDDPRADWFNILDSKTILDHERAYLRFKPFLTEKERGTFDCAWDHYFSHSHHPGDRGTPEKKPIDWNDKENCDIFIQQIENLLSYAKLKRGTMTTRNIKKIIAREGLIIIGILILLSAMLVLDHREREKKRHFERIARIAEIVEAARGDSEERPKDSGTLFAPTGIYVMLEKPTDLIRMQEVLKKDFPRLSNPQFIEWDNQDRNVRVQYYYDSNGMQLVFTDYRTAVIITIFLYPAYWLVRFIFWSVRTLKQ